MGVPKFYRWISERYPCLSEVVKEHQISEFDNLYLDMNGIIHVVSHPDDSNPHFRITEEKIFRDVFHYIDVLFRLIKPKKVFFMAIDGCAPRAKMNQQRGRRFRSAREAEELIAKAISKGEVLPSEDRFDSNCITPGTPFMVRLQEQLKYYVTERISNNELWQGPRVYLSGHETPGEGEHKIMDFIRSERARPDHDPNTRHCLYGLDADLIMLGLVSHEPHFSLLREEVRFGGKESQKRSTTPEDTTFHLLHLSLMREYIDFEFSSLKTVGMPFEYNVERIIDDWVLMGFLVGNDFIPHLPSMHIHQDGLPLLWGVYMSVLPTLDGYLNEDGKINLERFEKFMAELSKFDFEKFSENYADLKWFAGKTGGKGKKKAKSSPERKKYNTRKAEELYKKANKYELLDELDDPESLMFDSDSEVEEVMTDAQAMLTNGALSSQSQDELMMEEFKHHKRGYYIEKLHVECVTDAFLRDQALQYVRALQWILYYYYDGCSSWSWFFPFHYAPFISDIHSFADVEITFDLGRPFLPFEQLMAVLPAASKKLLPIPFQTLMTEETSPIYDYYPVKFETDLNGKQQEWEAVVLIPFIDENRLLSAMATREPLLTPEEKGRNRHGPCRLYQYSTERQPEFASTLPGVFPDIVVNHARCTELDMWEFVIPRAMLKRGLFDGVLLDVHFPGFPTFKHLPHTTKLKKANVKVFQAMSRGENMLVTPTVANKDLKIQDVAVELLGRTVFVRWPHLVEARVEAVSDGYQKIALLRAKDGKKDQAEQWERRELNEYERNKYLLELESYSDQMYARRGLVLGQIKVLVYVSVLIGRRFLCAQNGSVIMDKQYAEQRECIAYHTVVSNLKSHSPTCQQFSTIDDLYPVDSDVFMLGKIEYGAQGKVLSVAHDQGHVRVKFKVKQEPNFYDVERKRDSLSLQYLPSWMVGQRLSISSHLVSKITGSYRIANGHSDQTVNIGLNLKSNVKGEEVPGFTKKDKDQWLYSSKIVQILDNYMKSWPKVFEVIMEKSENEISLDELFKDSDKNINDLLKFIKGLECSNVPRVSHGCELIDEPVISLMEKELDIANANNAKTRKTQTMQVKPHLLYRPMVGNDVIADSTAQYQLFDRVVNVRIGFSVPLGLKGTVIGIYPGERSIDTMYEVLFDEEFSDGMKIRSSGYRAYRLYGIALINISHGERRQRGQKPAQIKNKNNSNAWNEPKKTNAKSEFDDIWSDLRKTNSPKKKQETAQSYSKCLKKESVDVSRTSVDESPVTAEYNGKMTVLGRKKSASKSRQKSEPEKKKVASLFEAAAVLPSVPPKPVEKQEPVVDDQFAALMNCLSMSAKKADNKAKPAAEVPNYGKKVSVEDLFKVAQAGTSVKAPEVDRAMEELLAFCVEHGLPPPRYEQCGHKDSQFLCQVTLGNQIRFQSSFSKSKEQAAHSAAAIALKHLKRTGSGPVAGSAFRPVEPARSQIPNRPVTVPIHQNPSLQNSGLQNPGLLGNQPYVHGFQNPLASGHLIRGPGGQMFPHGYMEPRVYPMVHPGAVYNQQRFRVQQRPSQNVYVAPGARGDGRVLNGSNHAKSVEYSGASNAKSGAGAPAAPEETTRKRSDSGNPFVPLQVSRQQKTPQKKSSSVDKEETEKEKSVVDTSNQQPSNTPTKTPIKKDESKSKKNKKQKKRLAANFTDNS